MPISKEINLLSYKSSLDLKWIEGTQKIFDPIRKKWYVLQPEEFVRQLVLQHLIHSLNYPAKRIGVEKQLVVDGLRKRFDVVVYDQKAHPFILIECKAPEKRISNDTAMQIAQYNRTLEADYLWITNGIENLFYQMDYSDQKANPIESLPLFRSLK